MLLGYKVPQHFLLFLQEKTYTVTFTYLKTERSLSSVWLFLNAPFASAEYPASQLHLIPSVTSFLCFSCLFVTVMCIEWVSGTHLALDNDQCFRTGILACSPVIFIWTQTLLSSLRLPSEYRCKRLCLNVYNCCVLNMTSGPTRIYETSKCCSLQQFM